LPVIRALELATGDDRRTLIELLTADAPQPRLLWPLLERYDALDYAREQAASLAGRARRRLSDLPASPAREVMLSMAEYVVSRSA
jgi:geranylgeranyl pyrophosphate synthase